MSNPPSDRTVEEIQEDIDFNITLLQSLDDSFENPAESKAQIESEINRLRDQLREMEHAPGFGQAQNVSASNYNGILNPSSSHQLQLDQPYSFDCPNSSHNSNMWSYPPNSEATSEHSSHADTPGGSSGSGPSLNGPNDASPTFQQLPTRKRLLSLGVGAYPEAKSRRATPSPAITAATTPTSTSDSFEWLDEHGDALQHLLGEDIRNDMKGFRREQKENERQLREQKEQERRDAEFARALQDSWNEESWNEPPPLPRSTSQTFLEPSHGGYRRMPPPPIPSVKSEVSCKPSQESAIQSQVNRNHASSSLSNSTVQAPSAPSWSFGNIAPSTPKSSSMPGGYIDISSDSDLEEIDPSDFRDSSRTKPSHNVSGVGSKSFKPGASSKDTWSGVEVIDDISSPPGKVTKRQDPYANYQTPMQPFGGYPGTNVYNAPSYPGAINGAYSLLDSQIRSYGSAIAGYGGRNYLPGIYPAPVPNYSLQSGVNPLPRGGNLVYGQYTQQGDSSGTPANPFDVDDTENCERYQEYADYLSNNPTKTKEEIKALLENIRPDQELPPENREGTPDAMVYPLMEHQKLGLTWMKKMEEGSNKGGILADDMGLGKTIQALALIISRPSEDRSRKTTLILAPVALMQQWKREIQKMIKPGHKLSVHILHGSRKDIPWRQLKEFDIVLTTYGTLSAELKRKQGWDAKVKANPNVVRSGKADFCPVLDEECKWYRVILDEAQCIKNKNTRAALAACHIRSTYRWCMSGTPMMNGVHELYSLIHFLRIKPYNESTKFNRDFTAPLRSSYETGKERAMRQLQALLKAILLRRTKKSQIDGLPILQLLPRTTESIHAVFSEDEDEFYKALESKTQLQFNKYLKAGSVGRNYSNVLILLLRLRQACCHPHLIKDFGIDTNPRSSDIDLIANAKELAPDVVARIQEIEAFDCPVCFDGVDNSLIFIPCGHNTCSECFARISDPSQAVAQGNDADHNEVKCPNCRGKVDPKRITDHTSFKKVYMPEEGDVEEDVADVEDEEEKDSDTESDDGEEDDDSGDSLKDFIVSDDDDLEVDTESEDEAGYRKGSTPFEKAASKKLKKDRKGKGKAKEKGPKKSLAQLRKESMKNAKSRRKYLRHLEKNWVTSAKIEKTMEILQEIRDRQDGEKTIIFSQFTSLLDLLEVPISRKDWGYKRYDGGMTPVERNKSVLEFTDKPNYTIMLVSLKAGNSGLNLVAASQVIIFDPFWNPYIEEQAIDRAHRIGQQRPVEVHRVLVENTVEDRILALQEKKRDLIEGAMDEKASENVGRLGREELAFLFGVSTNQ